MEWHIGCSGFHYKHLKLLFYPEGLAQRKWFEFYSSQFKTLELNVTFYRFPQLSFLQNWYNVSPPGFKFSVKAPKAITHFKQFYTVADLLSSFYDTINDGLSDKLGPVLFQMPPRFTYTEERLDRILENLYPSFQNVLELRHESWWQQTVYERLASRNISFCGMSHPQLPNVVVQNTPVVYYRFHGVPELYKTLYDTTFLQGVISQLQAQPATRQAWLYFNNDMDGHAPINAKEMMTMLNGNNDVFKVNSI